MLFNSLTFLVFFPVVVTLFFALPHKYRWLMLLAASCFFYMFFKPVYILILAFTIVIDYYAGILLENEHDRKKKKKWLIASLVANIGVLGVFKYYNFLNYNFTGLILLFHTKNPMPFLHIALPIGLSFHTFQAMSYTIEVYRGNQKAERHFGIYSLYVMFFPQLVAGPIERPQNLLHQFHEKKQFDYGNAVSGLRLMMWGMFKKVVVADRIGPAVDEIYSNPHNFSDVKILFAVLLFAVQIYCDFSGYSDIAIGAARVMGYKLMTNFRQPLSSKNVADFWRRWHISLSTWFYDYVFNPIIVPLRNMGKTAIAIGLIVTFILSGAWHGAGWKFIIYGLLNGIAIVYEFYTQKARRKLFKKIPLWLNNAVSNVITVGYISFTWIFFRASTTRDAFYIVGRIGQLFFKAITSTKTAAQHIVADLSAYSGYFLLAIFLQIIQYLNSKKSFESRLQNKPRYIRWGVYYAVCFAIIYFGKFDSRQFIYFQF